MGGMRKDDGRERRRIPQWGAQLISNLPFALGGSSQLSVGKNKC